MMAITVGLKKKPLQLKQSWLNVIAVGPVKKRKAKIKYHFEIFLNIIVTKRYDFRTAPFVSTVGNILHKHIIHVCICKSFKSCFICSVTGVLSRSLVIVIVYGLW